MKRSLSILPLFLALSTTLYLGACSDSSDSTTSSSDAGDSSSSSESESDVLISTDVDTDVCASESASDVETLVCAANDFLETLSESEQSTVLLDWSDSEAKTTWSNLPNASRNGLMFGDLDADSLSAAMVVAKAALSDQGYVDFVGVLAADDYLGNLQGSGGGGNGLQYSSDNYYIAFIGEPSTSGNWMLQIGGHHLAYNITYLYGEGYPVPNHIAAEPKASFELSSSTYAPLADEGDAMVAMFDALSSAELAAAYLNGETYSDVLMGPDNGSAQLPTDYPTGTDRAGVLVYELSDSQQTLVKAAISQWVGDYAGDVAEPLIEAYTSEEALADTYIAWAGSQSAGVDVDVANTYMRIDGPRLWIEVACQNGVVISGQTHYHTMYRDKTMDYGNSL